MGRREESDGGEEGGVGLFERLRVELRLRHYSQRTERAYVGWAQRFVAFHDRRHPSELGAEDLRAFLDDLVRRKVSASTHQQALCALQFLYARVLQLNAPWIARLERPMRDQRLPVVLSRAEVRAILRRMSGTPRLMAALLYGSGLRLLECARLRIKDVDLAGAQLLVRDGKGHQDRVTLLPQRLVSPLRAHLQSVRAQFQADVAAGAGYVELPGALSAKFPRADREWAWQWVFPATRHYRDSTTGKRRRHHLHESVLLAAKRAAYDLVNSSRSFYSDWADGSADMVRTDLTKSQRRRLAELAGLAYQRDLDAELAKLEAEFQRWRAGELSGHDLSDLIHAFHQGPSRELFKAYDHRFREFAVASALRRGVLTESEVGPDILALLAPNLSLLD